MLPALLRRTRRPGIVAVAFAVLLPLSACGSSSGDGGDSGATTTLTVYSGRSGHRIQPHTLILCDTT